MVFPVSYTHLDVYKRQSQTSLLASYRERLTCIYSAPGFPCDIKSNSDITQRTEKCWLIAEPSPHCDSSKRLHHNNNKNLSRLFVGYSLFKRFGFYENCFICDEPLSSGPTATVERGIKNLRDSSFKRGDEHIEHLTSVNSVTVHVVCRRDYTSKNSIEAYKKRRIEESPSTSQCTRDQRQAEKFLRGKNDQRQATSILKNCVCSVPNQPAKSLRKKKK